MTACPLTLAVVSNVVPRDTGQHGQTEDHPIAATRHLQRIIIGAAVPSWAIIRAPQVLEGQGAGNTGCIIRSLAEDCGNGQNHAQKPEVICYGHDSALSRSAGGICSKCCNIRVCWWFYTLIDWKGRVEDTDNEVLIGGCGGCKVYPVFIIRVCVTRCTLL